jgi:hypothetical protein
MKKVEQLKKRLKPGQAYRREELAQWSNAVDRHLKELLADGTLTKLAGGLYYHPKKTVFGEAPARDEELVETFLKDDRYLLASPNAYNALGVGTTQLYNETVVYNHKRHGKFDLGGRVFDFRVKPRFPNALTREFLLVDLVGNVNRLAEDRDQVLTRVRDQVAAMNRPRLARTVHDYGSARARKFFANVLGEKAAAYAA